MGKRWTKEELTILYENHNKIDTNNLSSLLPNRTINQIKGKANKLNLSLISKNKRGNGKASTCLSCKSRLNSNEISRCKECKSKISIIERYKKKYNIYLTFEEMYETYNLMEWYDFLIRYKNLRLPKCFHKEENYSKIWRRFITETVGQERESILSFKLKNLKESRFYFKKEQEDKYYSLIEVINLSFPEMNISVMELSSNCIKKISDDYLIKEFGALVDKFGFTIEDILSNKINTRVIQEKNSAFLNRIYSNKESIKSLYDLMISYLKSIGIESTYSDFSIKPNKYMFDLKNADYELDKYLNWIIESSDIDKNNINHDISRFFHQKELMRNKQHHLINATYYHYDGMNFYEWIVRLRPEWNLTPNDFRLHISKDGAYLDSIEELKVYEFIKYELNLNVRKASHKDKFYNEIEKESYIPDFIIDKYSKPVVIEYFGLYIPNDLSEYIQIYIAKAQRKTQFYKNQSFIFVELYPEDLKDDFNGIAKKLNDFIKYSDFSS